MDGNELIAKFERFSFGDEPGFGTWLSKDHLRPTVRDRLLRLPAEPLTKVQFNQLLVISQIASVSDGFFQYYWRTKPEHPYDVTAVEGFMDKWVEDKDQVVYDIEHLSWGLYRFYIDGLLYFGSVRAAFASLRSLSLPKLSEFFQAKRFDTDAIAARGPAMPLMPIGRDHRYLISEMVCKTFGEIPEEREAARKLLGDLWQKHIQGGGGIIAFRDFLEKYVAEPATKEQLLLSYDDVADKHLDSTKAVQDSFEHVVTAFLDARDKATRNTELYLSMVNDLDVYVATSMRTRANFRDMANACDAIFGDERLKRLHLRYFDPTMSAAKGHEDKGLIECLMVKCAKALVYCEGLQESYGKDAEAAMGLSLGKPVIFFCDHGKKTNFYRDVHPLARLIDFRSGVAVGAIVSDDVKQVAELLARIFENRMEYRLEHHKSRPGFLKLMERLTGSVVRLQTDDKLISKTFWNNYHNRARHMFPSLAAGKEAERLYE